MKSIQSLSNHGLIWKASASAHYQEHAEPAVSTGFQGLDKALLREGWPVGSLVELLTPTLGVGEISLFLPWLAQQVMLTQKCVAFIAPPCTPSVAALMAYGIPPESVWLLSPQRSKDVLWCQQQCLLEGHCCAVFMWHDYKVQDTDLRKLQLAAKQGDTLGVSIRPDALLKQTSPAPYRLQLERTGLEQVRVTVAKRRGGWAGEPVELNIGVARTARPVVSHSSNGLRLS